MGCVHDTLVSNSSNLGQQTAEAEKQLENLALIYGKMTTLFWKYMYVIFIEYTDSGHTRKIIVSD